MVAAGGVAEFLDEVGQHRLKDSGVHRGRGVIIHENWELHRIAPSPNCSRLSSMTVESRLRHDGGRTEFLHVRDRHTVEEAIDAVLDVAEGCADITAWHLHAVGVLVVVAFGDANVTFDRLDDGQYGNVGRRLGEEIPALGTVLAEN